MKLAGDSDTNCCIVGGMIGAYVGIDNIDQTKIRKVLECNILDSPESLSSFRPSFILPSHGCVDEMMQLLEIAPHSPL